MLMRKEDEVPHVELYVRRGCIDTEGRTIKDVLTELNQKLADIGCKSERWGWESPGSSRLHGSGNWPSGRILCCLMRGGSEAAYVDLFSWTRGAETQSPKLISSVKCWSWEEAVEMTALTAQLLEIID